MRRSYNSVMSARSADYLEAIEHLPAGATLVIPGVKWNQFEELLQRLESRPGFRVAFDDGRLKVMSPLREHEQHKEFISDIARVLSEEYGLPLEKLGSTTWRRKGLAKAVEADASFYVTNAVRISGKRTIDLESDPPPDIVVEVDVTNESLDKLPIYAALGVPEIWRYDGKQARIYRLFNGVYSETRNSALFSSLSGLLLTEFLDLAKATDQTSALRKVRDRLRQDRA
jgi:Uma2 family endonuclease